MRMEKRKRRREIWFVLTKNGVMQCVLSGSGFYVLHKCGHEQSLMPAQIKLQIL